VEPRHGGHDRGVGNLAPLLELGEHVADRKRGEPLAPDHLHDDRFEVVEAQLDATLTRANTERHAHGPAGVINY
jgi:hypothetical protein